MEELFRRKITRRALMGYAAALGMQAFLPNSAFADNIGIDKWDDIGAHIWVDSAGRIIELPASLGKLSPAGAYAQAILLSACPGMMATLAENKSTDDVLAAFPDGASLPVTGSLFAPKGSRFAANILESNRPDVIIDIGELKQDSVERLDELQRETGIPTLFIHAKLANLSNAYETLGTLLDMARAFDLAEYVRDVTSYLAGAAACVAQNDRYSLYLGFGADGATTYTRGSIIQSILESIGIVNAARDSEDLRCHETTDDDLLLWNPDAVVIANRNCYQNYSKGHSGRRLGWSVSDAAQCNRLFSGQIADNLWLDDLSLPSMQTLGALWLGRLLYPHIFDYDFADVSKDYYDLFYKKDSKRVPRDRSNAIIPELPSKDMIALQSKTIATNLQCEAQKELDFENEERARRDKGQEIASSVRGRGRND